MNRAQSTPGPWRIGDAGRTVFGPPNGHPAPEMVAHQVSRANARLIAAAPDMLEALRAVAAQIYAPLSEERNAAMARARAAIKKAEGKE